MTDIRLHVNGQAYFGWESARVVVSLKQLARTFSMTVGTERFSEAKLWPIRREDSCKIQIGDETLLEGYIERRAIKTSATSRTVTFSGYSKSQALVANSANPTSWTFTRKPLLEIARTLAAPHNIKVSVQRGVVMPAARGKVVISPGDGIFDALRPLAAAAGLLMVSDGRGKVLFARSGTERAQTIVQGASDIIEMGTDGDDSERFHTYEVQTQTSGTGDDGQATTGPTKVIATATDEGVRRTDRVHVIRPDDGITAASAQALADWTARIRAALADEVSLTLAGWTQQDGTLWPVNAITFARLPDLDIEADQIIAEAEFSIGEGGETVRLQLMRPDAFEPEPTAVVKS